MITGRHLAQPGLKPGDRFGPWKVLRPNLRAYQTERYPHGLVVSECQCTCGTVRMIRSYLLPRYDGQDGCQHKARNQTRHRTTQLVPVTPRSPAPPKPPQRRRTVTIPDEEIRPGRIIGRFRVLRVGGTARNAIGVTLECLTCGRVKRTPRAVVAAARHRACSHKPAPAREWSPKNYPGQAAALAWITENRRDRTVTSPELAAGLDRTRSSAAQLLRALAGAGKVAEPYPGCYALPGVTAEPPEVTGRHAVAAFIAADGGACFAEILAGTGIAKANLTGYLATLTRHGTVIKVDDPATRSGFYLLPGQQPGEVLELTG